jgi:copper chaperone
MKKIQIHGMTCNHCVASVLRALEKVPGVRSVVNVSLTSGKATVDGNPEPNDLINAVVQEGYQAEVVE